MSTEPVFSRYPRNLAALAAFAASTMLPIACGGNEFSGGTSSGTGGVAGTATTSGGNAGVGGDAASSTGGAGGAGGGGTGGAPQEDASGVDAASGAGGRATGGGGTGGRADASAGSGGSSGSKDDGGGKTDAVVNDVASDVEGDAPSVIGRCIMGGNDCPAGYQCACGGPGPGICECHKKCQSAGECGAPNGMCGCTPTDTVKICVSLCFCTCR